MIMPTARKMLISAAALLLMLPLGGMAQQVIRLPQADKPLTGQPRQLFSLGAEDGEDWELLAGVRSVAFDAKDNLYILDANNHRVLVFDANGRFVRKISKKGEGPGELMSPVSMTVDAGGTVVISDLGRRAFSLFKPDGTFSKNVPFPEGHAPGLGDVSLANALQAHPRAGVVARSSPLLMMRAGSPGAISAAAQGERITEFNWYELSTERSTTLGTVKLPPPKVESSDAGSTGGQRRMTFRVQRPNFEPPLVFGVLPSGGIALAHNVGYRVELISAAGKAERIIERPSIAARKATDRDKRLVIERQREAMKSGAAGGMQVRVGGGGATSWSSAGPPGELPSVDKMLEDAIFLDSIPVLRRIDTDPQGRVWIGRTASNLGPQGAIDLVASADGRYIGTIANDFIPNAVSRSGRAAYVQRDDLGVEKVVVKMLPATWQ
jgi:hypothetical protein